jgi:hypothetical protein
VSEIHWIGSEQLKPWVCLRKWTAQTKLIKGREEFRLWKSYSQSLLNEVTIVPSDHELVNWNDLRRHSRVNFIIETLISSVNIPSTD